MTIIDQALAQVQTPAQAREIIDHLAENFRLPGAGYFWTEDFIQALEEISNAHLPDDEPLTFDEDDLTSLAEHLSLSDGHELLTGESSALLHDAICHELGNWYADSEQMQQERENGANSTWHERIQQLITDL